MRLDKFLADSGIGTRSFIKKEIHKKSVTLNGEIVTDPGVNVCASDVVCYKNSVISETGPKYFMMNKPAGCICATKDKEKIVLDYLSSQDRKNVFPVGRLDKDTEGLLLLTDDGAWAHNLTSPRKCVEKTYYFEGEGVFVPNASHLLAEGIDIGDEKPTRPGILKILTEDPNQKTATGTLTISEGRYHQVKRMLAKTGVKVIYLKRLSIGSLQLDPGLKKGEYRMLTDDEIQMVQTGRISL